MRAAVGGHVSRPLPREHGTWRGYGQHWHRGAAIAWARHVREPGGLLLGNGGMVRKASD